MPFGWRFNLTGSRHADEYRHDGSQLVTFGVMPIFIDMTVVNLESIKSYFKFLPASGKNLFALQSNINNK
jgi:hypothetical protein